MLDNGKVSLWPNKSRSENPKRPHLQGNIVNKDTGEKVYISLWLPEGQTSENYYEALINRQDGLEKKTLL